MKKLTFIHAADLHIDSPFKGLTHLPTALFEQVRQSTFAAFDKLIEQAISHQVDFILLVGDLFDHEEQSLKAQIRLRDGFITLQSHGIPVYLSFGNHDFIHKGAHQVKFPENVFVFRDESVQSFLYEKDGEILAEIHGFSYERRSVKESKITHFPVNHQHEIVHIGMMHGAMDGNTDHHAYAPFRIEELKEKRYDYWALGHIHKRAVLQETPPIIYPGNIQGRHRKETGAKGCYLVEMTAEKTNLTFLPLHQIVFSELEVDLEGKRRIDDVESALYAQLESLADGANLISLRWKHVHPDQFGKQTESHLYELMEISNDRAIHASSWKFIYTYDISFAVLEMNKVNGLFMEEVKRAFQSMDITKEMSDLTAHPQARKYVESPIEEHLLADAKAYLERKLMQRSGGTNH